MTPQKRVSSCGVFQYTTWLIKKKTPDFKNISPKAAKKKLWVWQSTGKSSILWAENDFCIHKLKNTKQNAVTYILLDNVKPTSFDKDEHCTMNCTSRILTPRRRAHERLRVQNVRARDFPQDKLDSEVNARFLLKENLGVSLKFLVLANLESVGCEVYFPEKKS